MYIAEIRGKIPSEFEHKEDVLTSNVFSFFKYASRAIFLGPFLEMLGITATEKDLEDAEFIFWPTYEDGTEPDGEKMSKGITLSNEELVVLKELLGKMNV